MIATERRFESDIESFLISPAGGYIKVSDIYKSAAGYISN